MTVAIDINVLLDVFQKREPHYAASAKLLTLIEEGTLPAILPAHGLTTHYIVHKYGSKTTAETAMDRVLDHFQIGNLDANGWREARRLSMDDLEDAGVATIAMRYRSDYIITRDLNGFALSPMPAISPADFLSQGAWKS